MRFTHCSKRKNEQGITIVIVAFTLLALVAMAALAIDVASLYEARGEAQRAADSAALAGAKMFVSSGYTSNPGNWSPSLICQSGGPGIAAAVNVQAALAAQANSIAGQPAAIRAIQCDYNDANNNTDPRVTVTVEATNTPAYFARIWGVQRGNVSATASAEAYNVSGQNIPIELANVKPWAIPNCDPFGSGTCPNPSGYFINPSDGTVLPNNFIGKEFDLSRQFSGPLAAQEFYGLNFPASPPPVCPSTGAPSCSAALGPVDNYATNIACASRLPMHCGEPIGPGTLIPVATSTGGSFPNGPTVTATRCLIHADGTGTDEGQDILPFGTPTGTPINITGGYNNPNTALRGVENISRSDSIVVVPLYNGSPFLGCGGGGCSSRRVIGFLQLGLLEAPSAQGHIHGLFLNAVGCSPSLVAGYPPSPSNTISPGSVSPIIVRLVKNP